MRAISFCDSGAWSDLRYVEIGGLTSVLEARSAAK